MSPNRRLFPEDPGPRGPAKMEPEHRWQRGAASRSCPTGVRTKLSLQRLWDQSAKGSGISHEPMHPVAETRSELCPLQGSGMITSRLEGVHSLRMFTRPLVQHAPSPWNNTGPGLAAWTCLLLLIALTALEKGRLPHARLPVVGPRGRGAPPGKAAWLHWPSLQGQRHSCTSLCD